MLHSKASPITYAPFHLAQRDILVSNITHHQAMILCVIPPAYGLPETYRCRPISYKGVDFFVPASFIVSSIDHQGDGSEYFAPLNNAASRPVQLSLFQVAA